MSGFKNITIDTEDALIDAGHRLRVSQMTTLLDIKQINDNSPLFIDRENINGGTQSYSQTNGGTTLSVTTTGDAAVAQTKMFASYFSGNSHFGEITFNNYQNETDVTKRVGYFSSATASPYDSNKDGLWFEADGTDYRLRIQKGGTDVVNVTQGSWNNYTGSWFDPSKFNVFIFQFLYLGGTAVRFGFIHNGVIDWVHTHVHAGLEDSTFVLSPNQPVRYEIRSTGGAGSCVQVCCQIASEGSISQIGVKRGFSMDGAHVNANSTSTFYALLGTRLKSAYRNITMEEQTFSVLSLTPDDFLWEIRLNPTVSGTFTFNDVVNSSLQLAVGDVSGNPSTNTVTGGTVLYTGLGNGNSLVTPQLLTSAIKMGSTIDGVMDILVLCVKPLTSNLDITSSLNIQEYI